MKIQIIILLLISTNIWSQSDEGVYKLASINSLLTQEVQLSIDKNISGKRVVFLGESEHHIGSDFLAKTQFVKYLVLNHGHKDIAFEGDFFALYFEHDSKNLFPMWSRSQQCRELFEFLKLHKVTIWGIDNQISSAYTVDNFSPMLIAFMDEKKIPYETQFKNEIEAVLQYGSKFDKKLSSESIKHLIAEVDNLIQNQIVRESRLWTQILQSFKSTIHQYTSNTRQGIAIRDEQMAKNLNFLTTELHGSKFIVWAANAHISKLDLPFMENKTMGFHYCQFNPNTTYHIAFAPINMPYRKDKFIQSQKEDPNNLLHLLPNTTENYFIDSQTLGKANPDKIEKEYDGMFGLTNERTEYLKHFDALVFIANGEKIKYFE